MQMFGLISIVVTVGLVAWWLGASSGTVLPTQNEDGTVQESTYQETIEAAEDLVDKAEERNDSILKLKTSGKSVTVYDGISVPDNATALDLSGRGLSGSLKAEIRHLSNLKELDVSNNNFTGLPAEVGQLSKLEVLNLSNNPFTGLPYELGNLKNLEVLDLRGTQYAEQDLEIIKNGLPSSIQILTD